jgi:hypothetical protein
MKIELGKRYVTANGITVGPLRSNRHNSHPFTAEVYLHGRTGVKLSWTVDGKFSMFNTAHGMDLVKEYVEPTAEPETIHSSYVQQLAIKHTRPEVIKLDSDPDFALAAAKLSERLAHALLEDPRLILDRRRKQTVMLWNAACILLSRAGIGIIYEDDTLELME